MSRKTGFTLVELMVVMTLISVAVGTVTLGLRDVSDVTRVQTAVAQLTAMLRATHVHSTTSGRPVLAEFSRSGFRLCKPILDAERWKWHDGAWVPLDARLRLAGVRLLGVPTAGPDNVGRWAITVRPDDWTHRYEFTLEIKNGGGALATVAVFGGAPVMVWRAPSED